MRSLAGARDDMTCEGQ